MFCCNFHRSAYVHKIITVKVPCLAACCCMQLDEAITMEPDELSLFVSTKVLITSATSFVSPCPHFFGHMKIRAETKCAIIQIFDHHVTFECHSVYTYECLGNYVSAKAVFTLQGNWRWQWRLRSQYGAYGWAISHTFISNKEKVAAIILLWIYFLSLLHPRAVFYKLRNHSRSLRYIFQCQRSLCRSRAAQSSPLFGCHSCFFHLSGNYWNIQSLRKQLFNWQKSLFVSPLMKMWTSRSSLIN